MDKKKIIIIGAGIAGLSAGCYLQMNNYDTEIYEMEASSGGLCTSWKRSGYTFDGCLHWVNDCYPGSGLYHFWEEIGVIKNTEFVKFDVIQTIEDENGNQFILYSDPDKLKDEMISFGPEDKGLIEELTSAIKQLSSFKMDSSNAFELMGPFTKIKMLFQMIPFLRFIKKWDFPCTEFAKKLNNPFLKKIFEIIGEKQYYLPFYIFIFKIVSFYKSGYPIGGSLSFIKKAEEKYISLGGKINYKSKVKKILVEDNKATGIELENNLMLNADIVLSAIDGHYTIFEMLEGKYLSKKIENYYNGGLSTFPSIMQVSLGVAMDLSTFKNVFSFPLKEVVKIDEKNILKSLYLRFYSLDPTMAPEGKSSINSFFSADYSYWSDLRDNDRKRYVKEKERIASDIIREIDKRLPGFTSKVEVYDVATPATYIRYTNNWKGSYEGWLPDSKGMMTRISKELPGLKNFYMIGQWVSPGGGLPSGVITGSHVTQIICARDKKKFKVVA
jgi:phytoene dehydrogenase-like protein